jgi:Methyltransferase domain
MAGPHPAFRALPAKTSGFEYEPSYAFGDDRIDRDHARALELVGDVPGWLRAEDALKLYELAYFAPGPILEIGGYRGKSTCLMALAVRASGRGTPIISIDVDPEAQAATRSAARRHAVDEHLLLVRGTAQSFFRANRSVVCALIFVDGDHSYAGVSRDLASLQPHLADSGLLLLHDYNDGRNAVGEDSEIDVVRAVADSWVAAQCAFAGVFGACGLFQRTRGRAGPTSLGAIDVVRYDSMRSQYLQRVHWPLGRTARRLARSIRGPRRRAGRALRPRARDAA